MRKLLTLFLIVAILGTSLLSVQIPISHGLTIVESNWAYKIQVTIDKDDVDADLTDFPVVFFLSGQVNWTAVQDDCDDIRITDADLTILDYEIESYTVNTNIYMWVLVPFINSTADTTLWVYYGNPLASDAQSSADVWDGYNLVYHLFDGDDETGDDIDLTKQGAGQPADTTVFPNGAQDFDGTDYMQTDETRQWSGNTVMFEVYFNTTSQAYAQSIVSDNAQWGSAGYIWGARSSNAFTWEFADGTNPSGKSDTDYFTGYNDDMVYLVVVANYTSEAIEFYRNGVEVYNSVMVTSIFPNQDTTKYIGAYSPTPSHPLNGVVTEWRIYLDRNCTDAYVDAQFQVLENTFLSIGSSQPITEDEEAPPSVVVEALDLTPIIVFATCTLFIVLAILGLYLPFLSLIAVLLSMFVLIPIPLSSTAYLLALQVGTIIFTTSMLIVSLFRNAQMDDQPRYRAYNRR
jgi:hypothetical protein